jgi:single-strand DNA-binding protein
MKTTDNHVHLVGNLASAPSIIQLATGEKLARFAIATKEYAKNEQGKIEASKHWHRIVAKGRFASIIEEFAEKGSRIAIEGRLSSRFFRTKDGQSRFSTEIDVNDLVFLGHGNLSQSA